MEMEKAAGNPNKRAQQATENTCLYLRKKVMTENKNCELKGKEVAFSLNVTLRNTYKIIQRENFIGIKGLRTKP